MHNLSTISVTYPPEGHPPMFNINVPYNQFVSEFIQRNRGTLTHLQTPRFNFYNLVLSNLHLMSFTLKRPGIQPFINNFPVALRNMENLKIVEINLRNDIEIFSQAVLRSP